MTRALQIICVFSFSVLCAAATYACLELGNAAKQAKVTASTINSDVSTLETSLMRANGILNAINEAVSDPENGIQANLYDLHRTLLVAGGAITNTEKASRKWTDQENQLVAQSLTDEKSLNLALISVQGATDSLSNLEQGQSLSLSNLETTVSSSATQIAELSSSVEKQSGPIFASLSESSANIADTTASMDASAHDVQAFIHRETTPVRGTLNTIKAFLREFAGPAASVATAIK